MVHDLAGEAHWNARKGQAKPRLPSKLNAAVGDLIALLEPLVQPDSRVLEVGCAPGKFLLWCALARQAKACGVEYAQDSHRATVRLFEAAHAKADIRAEDLMQTTFAPGSFDVVYSFGVIEHFDDPRPLVNKHYEMLRPGGTAIITVPHFGAGSIYGYLCQRLGRENYDIHNISIMSEAGMLALAPEGSESRSYRYGRVSPWLLPWGKLPRPVEILACHGLNAIGLMQPFEIKALCPWLVLELTRPSAA
jgi:SAM-dependent methyltransferase